MNREAAHTLFRAHAAARLRGDTVEAARLASQIDPELRMNQVLFLTAFLAGVIVEEYGSQPDPTDLAALTKHLHDKHFRTDTTFNALRAEAMIRSVCGESILLTEIPFAEQPGYIWAVLAELVEPTISDDDLAEHFDLAEEAGLTWMNETLEATVRNYPSQTKPERESTVDPQAGPQVGQPVESSVEPLFGPSAAPPAGSSAARSVESSAAQPAENQTAAPAEQPTEPPTEPGTEIPTERPSSPATSTPAKESE
ncbi:hypothetical protein [Glycomyces sp. YM15]|uniref:hypothetical protein n=1 Tax=Glycomyces sp. YM15 TaxID=2800446 RepID=UPI0019629D21|nr:hypothetical protein [Glycomyces sp. YM15]